MSGLLVAVISGGRARGVHMGFTFIMHVCATATPPPAGPARETCIIAFAAAHNVDILHNVRIMLFEIARSGSGVERLHTGMPLRTLHRLRVPPALECACSRTRAPTEEQPTASLALQRCAF